MHTALTTMPSIGHDIPPYKYHGLSLEELPLEAQMLLTHYGLSSDSYDPDVVEEVRRQREGKLSWNLRGVFSALVAKRREVASINAALARMEPGPEYEEAEDAYVGIARHVFHELLPEMHEHIDKFIEEADALVWLEHHARDGTPDAISQEEMERYRDNKMTPIIESASELLFRLDAAIVLEDLQSLGKKVNVRQTSPSNANMVAPVTA